MLLQERLYLRPRVESEQSPQLGGRELPSTVFLKGKCFQRCTGKVFAQCRQVSGTEAPLRVKRDAPRNTGLSVKADDGHRFTYDPRRLQGVTLYHETERAFARGDRVQLTAPDRTREVANRELGTVERIEPSGRVHVRLDSGRTVAFEDRRSPPPTT